MLGPARVARVGTAGEDLGSYRRVGFWGEVPTEPLRDIFSGEAPPDPPLGLSCIQQMLMVPPAGEAELRTIPHLCSTRSPSLGPRAWGVERHPHLSMAPRHLCFSVPPAAQVSGDGPREGRAWRVAL